MKCKYWGCEKELPIEVRYHVHRKFCNKECLEKYQGKRKDEKTLIIDGKEMFVQEKNYLV